MSQFALAGVGRVLLLGVLVCGCSTPPRAAADQSHMALPLAAVTTASSSGADAGAAAAQAIDLLHPLRTSGLPAGEWTIFYPTKDVAEPVVFMRILRSPRGGFVALGAENESLGKHFILRLEHDGTPRWAVRFTWQMTRMDEDVAVGEDGTIALVAHHLDRVTVEGREVVAGGLSDSTVSLLLFGDDGKLRRVLSRKRASRARSTRVVWRDGFVTTRTDIFDPPESPQDGLVTIDAEGRDLGKTTRSLAPLLLAAGRDLVAISLKADVVQGGRTLLRTSSKGSPYMAVALDRTGAFLWGHAFSDPLVREQTALAEDERGHVFAAFRYGESHGYADDPYAAIVYELDDKGREVRRFKYEPNAAFTRLFPAPDGLTAIGWFRAAELTFQGKPVPLPVGDPNEGIQPGLLMRLAPDGRALASRKLLNWALIPLTETGMVTIADAAPAGAGQLAVVGAVAAGAPFAGLSVAKGEPRCSFAARIHRP